MSKKTTTHRDGGKEIERTETRNSDGTRKITESEVHRGPLGRSGSTIVKETTIDKSGNSTTKRK